MEVFFLLWYFLFNFICLLFVATSELCSKNSKKSLLLLMICF